MRVRESSNSNKTSHHGSVLLMVFSFLLLWDTTKTKMPIFRRLSESFNIARPTPIPFNHTAPESVFSGTYASKILSKLVQESMCNNVGDGVFDKVWAQLCKADLVYYMDQLLQQPNSQNQTQVRVVQIGAHVGFEENDPLGDGLLKYLKFLPQDKRQHFQWTFVEPSSANFKSLQQNLANYAYLGMDLHSIQAGVVSDSTTNRTYMTFYSIRDTIDPISGFDSLSGKAFPPWITQVSSFSFQPIKFNRRVWTRLGLNMMDYVVQENVTTRRYTDLMKDMVFQGRQDTSSLALVLIDTEGFDCHIVNGISPDSSYLPKFLVFEHKQCHPGDLQTATKHLESMGYTLEKLSEDFVAYKN
jgi:hypothetical protein